MTKRHASQKVLILGHLRNGPITQLAALKHYGCARLAAVILKLRDDGHEILTENVPQSGGSYYGRYHLVKERGK